MGVAYEVNSYGLNVIGLQSSMVPLLNRKYTKLKISFEI